MSQKDGYCNKKRICIIRSNPVNPDSRVEKIAYTLINNGYSVSVFAWDRECDYSVKKEYLRVEDKDIPVARVGFKASYGEGFKNIVPYLRFQKSIKKWIKKSRFDIVHACDFDTAFSSYIASKKMGSKLVFDIFDFLYCEPVGLFQKLIRSVQFAIINSADATIICTEKRKQQIKGSKPKRLSVIYNTPMEGMIDVSCASNSFEESIKADEPIRVVYVGVLQDYRLLKEIGQYFSENRGIEFHIGGYGKYDSYFEDLSSRYDNIIYYGRLSYKETLELESKADIMLAIYDPLIDNHKYAAPNKFYESLMLGKPVIMVKGTGMSEIVEKYDIGEIIDYSVDGFDKGLNRLIRRRNEWREISIRMKGIYKDKYSWSRMSQRLLKLYSEL